MFIGTEKKHGQINTLRLELRLVRGLGLANTTVKSVPSTDAVSLFRSGSFWFLAEAHVEDITRRVPALNGYPLTSRNKYASIREYLWQLRTGTLLPV